MGKKQKRGGKQSSVPHREAFMRMNFLLQASMAVLAADPSRAQLSRFYLHTMRSVSKRLVLRMDPRVKRMMCKSCDSLLVSGVTATHRVRAHRERHLVVKCLTCGNVRRFLARPGHQLWSDNPSNVVEPSPTGEAPTPTTVETNTLPNPITTVPQPTTADGQTATTADQSSTTVETNTIPDPTTTVPQPSTADGQTATTADHSTTTIGTNTIPDPTTTVPQPTTMDHSDQQTHH